MTRKTDERTDSVQVSVPEPTHAVVPVASDVPPLNCENALRAYTETEQREIQALADSIDVTKIDNVMNYGAIPLKMTFEQTGQFLKTAKGTRADQKVIAEVIELSQKASESSEEFELVLKEPNFLQKLFMKMSSSMKESRTKKIQETAMTCYQLLAELKQSYDLWLDMLKESIEDINDSGQSDIEAIKLLEKYIIAGNIAKERLETQMNQIQTQYQETGLQQYSYDYEEFKQGYDVFCQKMQSLAESRVMYYLSISQLALTKRSNINVQVSIHTKKDHSMALIGQQLRNAVLNARTREVLEGQKSIARLSDELIKNISKGIGITAEETEKMLYSGIYNVEAAKEAVTTVIDSCNAIKTVAEEMIPKMEANMAELDGLVKKLQPYIGSSVENLKIEEKQTPPTGGNELKF